MPLEGDELQWLDEEVKAAQRIGNTPEQAMQWVIRFAQTELSTLSEGQWSDLMAEVDVFMLKGPPLKIGRTTSHVGAAFDWGGAPSEEYAPRNKWIPVTIRPPRKAVEELHRCAQMSLEAVAKGNKMIFQLGPLHLTVEPVHPSIKHGGLTVKTHTPFDAFAYHVAHLLVHHNRRVRRCTECKSIFLAERKNQQYCTSRCLSRVTQRRWRERHKKKAHHKGVKQTKRTAATKGGSHHGKKVR
jgi:hypothetical protein